MIDYLKNACEEIDASFFSGDAFYYPENRVEFEKYIGRWNRQLKVIQENTCPDCGLQMYEKHEVCKTTGKTVCEDCYEKYQNEEN
jgi:formylmethanofuran dehydrogenase subunit E